MKADKFIINNMKDADTMNGIKHTLTKQEGIIAVRVDMQADTITVDYDEDDYDSERIKLLINREGLDVKGIK